MRRQFTQLRIAWVYSLSNPRGQETWGWGGDDNHALFLSVSLICFYHQSPFDVLLYQICLICFYYVKVNKTQVILFFYFISFANII